MGQKVNPISNRLGIIRGWDSNWFGGKDYGDKLVEDFKIRKYLNARLSKAGIAKIVIERTLKLVTITINTARPGIIIGRGGSEVDALKEELKKLTDKEIQINIFEVKRPELDAVLVGSNIARQLEGRVAYRRAIKMAIQSTMKMGAEGIKILIAGRLNGAEMARSEIFKEGRIPLHTFRADIDYAQSEALTTYGQLGIKVWICKGEVYGKRELVHSSILQQRENKGGEIGIRRDGRDGGGRRDNRDGGRDGHGGGRFEGREGGRFEGRDGGGRYEGRDGGRDGGGKKNFSSGKKNFSSGKK